MEQVRYIGLDVHKETVTMAVAEADGSAPATLGTIAHDVPRIIKRMRQMGKGAQLKICYEAGCTGFGLCRALREAGYDCIVVAPSLVPKQPGVHMKTDRRDAERLARFLRSGDLTAVFVPDAACEAVRDLERSRYDAKKAEVAARNQLLKFLLRHGRVYRGGKGNWTAAHMGWIQSQAFDHEAQNRVLVDYVHAVLDATSRIKQLDKDIEEVADAWAMKPLVQGFQALRGIRLLSAVVAAAELVDMSRFASARQLASFIGMVPSEHSSGERLRQGHITRAGNRFVRRILVEAAWHYRLRPSMRRALITRNKLVSEAIRGIAWKAQQRLHSRFVKLSARGKTKQKIVVAIARELAGFLWSIGRQVMTEQSSKLIQQSERAAWPSKPKIPMSSNVSTVLIKKATGGAAERAGDLYARNVQRLATTANLSRRGSRAKGGLVRES